MPKKILLTFAILLMTSCSKKPSYISNANNSAFNANYKNQSHILPLHNFYHIDSSKVSTQFSDSYYQKKKEQLALKYKENADYFNFLNKNDIHSKISSVVIETLPKENYHYIELAKKKDLVGELNKLNQVEIDYILFLRQQTIAKLHREYHGDPITHPLVYEPETRTDTQMVMGDEYRRWETFRDI